MNARRKVLESTVFVLCTIDGKVEQARLTFDEDSLVGNSINWRASVRFITVMR